MKPLLDIPPPNLRLNRVTKRFGIIPAVLDVSFDIAQGECLALFGPNGAGKSTLLRLVAGLTQPTTGVVERFPGQPQQAGRGLGYVSHQSLLYNELTGLENLIFYARLHSVDDPLERAEHMLDKMDLYEARHRRAREYSRGMKQRLTLARALLHDPGLLLLDEPFSGLDFHGARLLSRELSRLKDERRTILLVTHSLSEGLEIADRILIQHRGRIRYDSKREGLDRQKLEAIYFSLIDAK